MMKRQRSVMGRSPSFMAFYHKSHELAFGSNFTDLWHDGGLPEHGHGYGWYSANRLSYAEWYRQCCARMAYDEIQENTPMNIFYLLVGSLEFPLVAISSGILYIFSATRRVRNLYLDNGVQVAKTAISSKLRNLSQNLLWLLSSATIGIMIYDNYS